MKTSHIAYEVGYFTDGDLVKWAIEYLSESEYFYDEPEIIKLMSIKPQKK